MLFNTESKAEPQEFWSNREKELGVAILGKTLGRIIDKERRQPLWGLFYTTKASIYFQTFESQSWFASMVTSGKSLTKNEIIEIPVASLVQFKKIPQSKGWLGKILWSPSQVEITWQMAEQKQTILFEMDSDADAFVESIQ